MSRIRDLRLERGWTQEQLGKMLNVQKAAVSKYENGTASPSNEVLKKLSNIFGVSIDFLLDNQPNFTAPTYYLTKDESNLLGCYRTLDAEGRGIVDRLIGKLRSISSKAATL